MSDSDEFNILVVDDSEKIQTLVSMILSSCGYNITTANNGAQALDEFSKKSFDLVILDLAMPVMDGYETMKRMLDEKPTTNILLLSAMDNDSLKQKCLDLGAIGYISKPFTRNELLSTVRNTFSKSIPKDLLTFANDLTKSLNSLINDILAHHVTVSLDSAQLLKSNPSEINIDYPGISEGYVTECKDCPVKVISFIDIPKKPLMTKYFDDTVEFFNIANSKILSTYAKYAGTSHVSKPTRLFSDNDHKADEAMKLDFTVNVDDNDLPLECIIKLK